MFVVSVVYFSLRIY